MGQMHDGTPYGKASQLEADFGVVHPMTALRTGLRNRLPFYKEVTPLQAHVGRERIGEIEARGYGREEALIVLLMRGAVIEDLATAAGIGVDEVVDQVEWQMRRSDPVDLIPEAQRLLNLWWRS